LYETIGRPFYLGDKPGSAQTMKLVNNLLAATGLIATCEAVERNPSQQNIERFIVCACRRTRWRCPPRTSAV
jgi:hypothetical protein